MTEIKITVDLPQERIDQLNRIETMLAKLTSETRPERAYTSEQVCALLNISSRTLFNWRELGKIGYYQDGKVVRFTESDVMKKMQECHIKPQN